MSDNRPHEESSGSAGSVNQLRHLPANWRWARLKDVCTKVQDGTHFSPKEQSRTGEFKYITAKNIKHWGLDLSNVSYLSESVHREIYKRCNPEKGDVLYIKDGVTTGVAAVNSLDEEFSLLSSVALLKPRRDDLDPRFLTYYLNSSEGYRIMTGQMTGTAIKRLILQKIKESFVPVAPMAEQREIVAEIEKQFTRLEAGVAGLRRVQANLKRYRAAVLKAACEGKLVPTEAELARQEGRTYESGAQLLERILAERRQNWRGRGHYREPAAPETANPPPASEGWTVASIDQCSADTMIGLDRGRAQQSDDVASGVPYIKMNNVTMDGRVLCDDLVHVPASREEATRFAVQDGDILFNTRNSKELVGKVGIVRTPPVGAIYNNNLMRIRLAGGVSPAFLVFQMCSHDFRRRMGLVKKATTNVAAVYAKDLLFLAIAFPSLAEQTRIVAEVERRLSVVEELEAVVSANLQRSTRLRQSILQKAFTGKL